MYTDTVIDVAGIAEVLGGTPAASMHELAEQVAAGLPKAALRHAAQRIWREPKAATQFVYRVVPEATYKRRSRLSPAESERTERLARVIASAEQVWGDKEQAHAWLKMPHPELDGKSPLECSFSELGARVVEELLDRLYFGLPA